MDYLLVVQGFIAVIIIGVLAGLWKIAKTYGGLIGNGLRWVGLGLLFFSLESLDRILGDLSFVDSISLAQAEIIHNLILLFGLLCSAIGFSKLTRAAK